MSVHCHFRVNFNTYFFLRDKLPISMKMLVFVLSGCVGNAVKTMAVDRKNQKALALLYLASKPLRKAANSSGVPTEFGQNRRGKFELFAWTLSPNFSPKLNFSPSTKKTTEYSFELFFSLTNLFLNFVVFACFATTRVNMRFRAKTTRDSAQGYIQCMKCIGDPVVQTDGRTDGHVSITSLPKFLGLIGYQISLAMELRSRASALALL